MPKSKRPKIKTLTLFYSISKKIGCRRNIREAVTTVIWTAFRKHLRQPIGHIHWAGSETATVWNGYMEGTVRSGERVAEEIGLVFEVSSY